MSNTSSSSGGVGFVGLLTIAFIVLKLTNYIDWSWWWVLSPVWIGVGIFVIALCVALVIAVRQDEKRKTFRYW